MSSAVLGRSFPVHVPGNPLLLNSSLQPDLTVGRAYSTPLCFQDAADKELFDPLPDIKVKVQSSFMVSLGVAERAEFHAKAAETFPRDPSWDYCLAADRRANGLLALNGPFSPAAKEPLTTAGVFGHEGGRLVAPNTGEFLNGSFRTPPQVITARRSRSLRGLVWANCERLAAAAAAAECSA